MIYYFKLQKGRQDVQNTNGLVVNRKITIWPIQLLLLFTSRVDWDRREVILKMFTGIGGRPASGVGKFQ